MCTDLVPAIGVEKRLAERLAAMGIGLIGEVCVLREWELSRVVRCETSVGTLCYKEVPAIFAHEGRVSSWLAQRIPHMVPRVVGFGDGWLLNEFVTASSHQGSNSSRFAAIAEIQRLIDPAEAFEIGVPLRTPRWMLEDLRRQALGGACGSWLPETLTRWLLPFEDACSRYEQLDIPVSLVHGDLSEANVVHGGDRVAVIDWTDVHLGLPFEDLCVLGHDGLPQGAETLLKPWRDRLTTARVEEALRLLSLLGPLSNLWMHVQLLEAYPGQPLLFETMMNWLRNLEESSNA